MVTSALSMAVVESVFVTSIGNGQMTTTEYITHMSLWCLLKAPLIMGNDPRNMSSDTLMILSNKEVSESVAYIDKFCSEYSNSRGYCYQPRCSGCPRYFESKLQPEYVSKATAMPLQFKFMVSTFTGLRLLDQSLPCDVTRLSKVKYNDFFALHYMYQ